jgi:hypothetical protein
MTETDSAHSRSGSMSARRKDTSERVNREILLLELSKLEPQEFASRFSGQPCPSVMANGNFKWSTAYYPSPESHRLAFDMLEPVIELMIAARHAP